MCVGSNLDGLIISLDKWLNTFLFLTKCIIIPSKESKFFLIDYGMGLVNVYHVSAPNYEVGILWLSNKDMLNKAYFFEELPCVPLETEGKLNYGILKLSIQGLH